MEFMTDWIRYFITAKLEDDGIEETVENRIAATIEWYNWHTQQVVHNPERHNKFMTALESEINRLHALMPNKV